MIWISKSSTSSESSQQKIHGSENHVAVFHESAGRGSKLFARYAGELRSHEYVCLVLELQDRSKVVHGRIEMRMDNAQDLAPKVSGVKQIAQTADVWAFEAYNLAVRRPPR